MIKILQKLRASFLAGWNAFGYFWRHPFHSSKIGGKAFARWLWYGVSGALRYVVGGLRRQWVIAVGVAVALLLLLLVGFIAYWQVATYYERQMVPVLPPQNVVYLDQGWGGTEPTSDERLNFYYLPQGAFLKDIRYWWLAYLERPWNEERFADAKYLRAYGFIVDTPEVKENPGALPVGFSPRYDPKYNEMMLDLNCAVCHTGELHTTWNGQRTAVRIDGGPGHQDFTGMHAGQFAGDLGISLFFTRINPFRFRRFARAVLKEQYDLKHAFKLWSELGEVLATLQKQKSTEDRLHIHPIEDGYGRTDGLAGIENSAFAINLEEKNYVVANAPVSYPFVWDIPWLNWVQYTTSVRQPMARNIGEAMGTGARYYLQDPYGAPLPASERFDASLKLANLTRIEDLLRTLRAPCWPENIFGPVNKALALQGKRLFEDKYHCVNCHGPHEAPAVYTAAEAPLKLQERNPLVDPYRSPALGGAPPETWQFDITDPNVHAPYRLAHWILKAKPAQEIGTDVTSALNFFRDRFDLRATGMKAEEVRTELTPYWTADYKRQVEYWSNLVVLLDEDGTKLPRNLSDVHVQGTLRKPVVPDNGPGAHEGLNREVAEARLGLAQRACLMKGYIIAIAGRDSLYTGAPVQLDPLTPLQLDAIGNPDLDTACPQLKSLLDMGLGGYLRQNLGSVNLASASGGQGLNYLITLVRKRAYQDMDVSDDFRRQQLDGYGQIDTPQGKVQYHARPLAGIWATAPFLHNGSVPSLYEMLLPAYRRTKKFYLRQPNFDPRAVGLFAGESQKGAFLFDTTLPGNNNAGHEFRAGYREKEMLGGMPMNGVIGPEMTDDERWAIIEYLKIKRDIYDPVCPEEKYTGEKGTAQKKLKPPEKKTPQIVASNAHSTEGR